MPLKALLVASCFCSVASAAGRPVIISTARVSPVGSGPHFWLTVSSNPADPSLMIISAIRNGAENAHVLTGVLYGSDDGGLTWRTLREEMSYPAVSEVTSAFGSARTIYFLASGDATMDPRIVRGGDAPFGAPHHEWSLGRTVLMRSTDFGATWLELPSIRGYTDAPSLIVVPAAARGRDRLIVFSHRGGGDNERPQVAISPDEGLNFGAGFKDIPDVDNFPRTVISSGAVMLPDGTYGGLYSTTVHGQLRALTFNRVAPDGSAVGSPAIIARPPSGLGPGYFPPGSIAIGVVPDTGIKRLYAAWSQMVSKRSRIVMATSDNNGVTWSPPHELDDVNDRPDLSTPAPASYPSVATTSSGVVGIIWLQAGRHEWRFSASFDGGKRFGPSIPLGPVRLRPDNACSALEARLRTDPLSVIPSSSLTMSISDWKPFQESVRGNALKAIGMSRFVASWTGKDGVVYSAVIGTGGPTESSALRQLIGGAVPIGPDVLEGTDGRRMFIDYTTLRYDRAADELRVGVVIGRNRKNDSTPLWPLVLRVLRLTSAYGSLEVMGADNEGAGVGAAWVFDGPSEILPPGSAAELNRSLYQGGIEYSKPRTLRFKPRNLDVRDPVPVDKSILDVDFEVLATPSRKRV